MSPVSTNRSADRAGTAGGRPAGRPRQVLSGLVALGILLATLVGVPVLLAVLGGNPLPDHVPSLSEAGQALTSPDDGTLFLRVLAVVGWVGWATFALSVLVEVPAAVRRRPAPRLPGLRAQQRIAATLIAGVALLGTSGVAANAATPVAPVTAVASSDHGGTASWSSAVARDALPPLPVRSVSYTADLGGAPRPVAAGGGTYVVAPGDRLADVAGRFLGDPGRYPELARANGLSDADEISPGQRLVLPPGARDRGASQYAAGPVQERGDSYVVAPGDRLSDVAERFLGDADRYPELATGSGVRDPDTIRPGQRIVLPPDARDRGTDPHASGHVDDAPDQRGTQPGTPAPSTPAPGHAPGHTAPRTPAPSTPTPATPAPGRAAPSDGAPATPAPGHAAPSTPAPGHAGPGDRAPAKPGPGRATPSDTAPSTAAPATPAPGHAAPSDGAPATPAPGHAAPSDVSPSAPAPATSAPARPAPGHAAPSDGAPSIPAPATPAPGHAAPSGAAPSGAAPSGAAPSGAAPSDAAPSGAAPSGAAPGGSAPTAPPSGRAAPSTPAPASGGATQHDPASGGGTQHESTPGSATPDRATPERDENGQAEPTPAAHSEGLSPLLPIGVPLAGAGLLAALLLARGRREEAFVGRHRRHRTTFGKRPTARLTTKAVARDGFVAAPPRPRSSVDPRVSAEPGSPNPRDSGDPRTSHPRSPVDPRDSGPRDSGPRDSGSRDSGSRDSGSRDSGPRDSGSRGDGDPRGSGPRTSLDPRISIETHHNDKNPNPRLDAALRALSTGLAERPADAMPDVLGAWIDNGTVRLVLDRPCPNPPAPWTSTDRGWELAADDELPDTTGIPAPLPMLVTVGTRATTAHAHLLLDVERLGVVTLTGDEWRANDLLRHIGAELAGNPWSDDLEILVAGFDSEQTNHLAMIGDGRIEPVPTIGDGIARMRRRVSQALGLETQKPGRHAVKEDDEDDEWAPTVLLVADPDLEETIALGELDAELATTGRCGVGVVASLRGDLGRWPLQVTGEGSMAAKFIREPELLAARLSPPRLAGLAELFVDSALTGP